MHWTKEKQKTYCGKEHGESIDGGLNQVIMVKGHNDCRQEEQVAEGEQEGGQDLGAYRLGFGSICAAPASPACKRKGQGRH